MNAYFPMRKTSVALIALLVVLSVLVSAPRSWADRNTEPTDSHCVVDVVEQRADGELVMGAERCYETFSAAMFDASDGILELPATTSGDAVFTNESLAGFAATFTLGIHYDGYWGTGGSITIKGSSCSGGYWNPVGWWMNRISSSYNGCYHLKHHDKPNRAGTTYHTYTKYQIDNIGSVMNNRTESVSYWSY